MSWLVVHAFLHTFSMTMQWKLWFQISSKDICRLGMLLSWTACLLTTGCISMAPSRPAGKVPHMRHPTLHQPCIAVHACQPGSRSPWLSPLPISKGSSFISFILACINCSKFQHKLLMYRKLIFEFYFLQEVHPGITELAD